jgi:hypothetical protein
MPHPDVVPVSARKEVLSDLLRRQRANTIGDKVNVCPFGCRDEELDEHGYCDHLVGFTNDKKVYEAMEWDEIHGRRIVRGNKGLKRKDCPQVKGSDILVQISCSWRVYRKNVEIKHRPVIVEPEAEEDEDE